MSMTPLQSAELRSECARTLSQAATHSKGLSAFVGLDGFVDEIIRVVDQRTDAGHYTSLATIADLAGRIAEAAGKSTNLELVNVRTKLGGNGPIMANALAHLDVKTTYVGALGYPNLHPVFNDLSQRASLFSVAEPGHTDALEFEDGKLMFGKTTSLNDLTWENIQERWSREAFTRHFTSSSLVAFVNWTMIPTMSQLWEQLLKELCPALTARRWIFFDLADPQKRTKADILHAIDLINCFSQHFDVLLGLNEKEAFEIGEVLGIPEQPHSPDGVASVSQEIFKHLKIHSLTVHPVTYALSVSRSGLSMVSGPGITKVVITTGAGDHYNAGFCVGRLLGLTDAQCVQVGVATSGYYVSTGNTPSLFDLAGFLQHWPVRA